MSEFYLSNITGGTGVYTKNINASGFNMQQRWDYYNNSPVIYSKNILTSLLATIGDSQNDPFLSFPSQVFYKNPSGILNPKILNKVFVSKNLPSGVVIDSVYSGQIQASSLSGYQSGAFLHYGYLTLLDSHDRTCKGVLATFIGNNFYQGQPNTNRSVPFEYIDSGVLITSTGIRLVLELGAQLYSTQSGYYSFSQSIGKIASGNLPINQTAQGNNYKPWLAINNNIF